MDDPQLTFRRGRSEMNQRIRAFITTDEKPHVLISSWGHVDAAVQEVGTTTMH